MNAPPVIDTYQRRTGMNPVPPPLPAQVLQKELVSGCLANAAAALEADRQQSKRCARAAQLWFGVLAFIVILVFVGIQSLGGRGEITGAPAIAAAAATLVCVVLVILCLVRGYHFLALSRVAEQRYRDGYKQSVFTAAIRLLNPSFLYQPRGGISLDRFCGSRMFLHRVERYHSEDYVHGVQGATAFEFAEVRSGYDVVRWTQKENEYRPVFHGLYFIADFNKHFATSVIVLPRSGEQLGVMTELFDKWGWKRGRIIHLEDPEFEREFVVHAQDEVEARYLLTPALMRRILEIRRMRGRAVSLSFLEERLHVALEGYEDLFEPDSASSTYSIMQIQLFLNQVQGVLSLVDLLNLNTRIWSKR